MTPENASVGSPSTPSSARTMLRTAVAGLVIGGMSMAFVISFAALIYAGPLSDFLGVGIFMALIGASGAVIVGAWRHRLPVLSQPQDATTVLIAGGAANIAAVQGAGAGPTVMVFVAAATCLVGLLLLLAGYLRLGYLARFIPFPVLAGFLAATGYLLVTGAIGLLVDSHVDIYNLANFLAPEHLVRWVPWLAVGGVIAFVMARTENDMALPVAVLLSGCAFYLILGWAGLSLEDATDRGLLLGPFPESKSRADIATMVAQVDWGLILSSLVVVPAIVAITMLGTLLNMSGLEIALGRRTQLDSDLRAVGLTNIVCGPAGGIVSYPMIGETLLAQRFGLQRGVAVASIVIVCGFGAVFGRDLLALLPRGVFAAVIGYLGIDMLVRWLWVERRNLPVRDALIVVVILAAAAFIGFLEAIAIGFGLAAVIFVASYARLNPIHAHTTASARRSGVERASEETAYLAAHGHRIVVLELTGFLFFGSAHTMSERARALVRDTDVHDLILDFSRVPGIDSSALQALSGIAEVCAAADVRVMFTALPPEAAQGITGKDGTDFLLFPRLDDALLDAEERLLAAGNVATTEDVHGTWQGVDLLRFPTGSVISVTLSPGETLFEQGSSTHEIFVLRDGALRAQLHSDSGAPLVVARYRPGAVIGEIAYYSGLPRTASVVSETLAVLWRIDLDRLEALAPDTALALHASIARHMAQRLARTTQLVNQLSR